MKDITYNVRIYETEIMPGKTRNRHRVRWKVTRQGLAPELPHRRACRVLSERTTCRRTKRRSIQPRNRRAGLVGKVEAIPDQLVRLRRPLRRHEMEGCLGEVPARHCPSHGRGHPATDRWTPTSDRPRTSLGDEQLGLQHQAPRQTHLPRSSRGCGGFRRTPAHSGTSRRLGSPVRCSKPPPLGWTDNARPLTPCESTECCCRTPWTTPSSSSCSTATR